MRWTPLAILIWAGACGGTPTAKPDASGAGGAGGRDGAAGRNRDATVTDTPVGEDVPVVPTDGPPGDTPGVEVGPVVGPLGSWSEPFDLRVVSVHAALLPGGKILVADGQSTWGSDVFVWNTDTGEVKRANAPSNIFCSTYEQMPDGRVLVVGGHLKDHYGSTDTNIFDPVKLEWTRLANMFYPRWYPSTIILGDGRYLTVAGESACDECNVEIPELYDAALDKWTRLETAAFPFEYYPQLYLLPDGRVLAATTTRAPLVSQVLSLGAAPTWNAVGGPAVDGGSSVMFRPGKILKVGTSTDPDKPARAAAKTAYVLDMVGAGVGNQIPDAGAYVPGNGPDASPVISVPWPGGDAGAAGPLWRQVGSMKHGRAYLSLTVLPDGTVLATGGGGTTAPTDVANAVLETELWSPVTETWTTLAALAKPRLYHSEALLLPDGRVAILGGGRFDNATVPEDQTTAEIFSPPYLGKGPRPRITAAPAKLTYGQAFSVSTPDAARVASVSLVRFGAATHAYNAGQRFVPLTFTAGADALTVTAPEGANLAPGGSYMLFLVDMNGVPSLAAETRL